MQSPEERLAASWLARLKLSPPFEIEEVLRQFAQIDEDDIPFDADAVLIARGGGSRPNVVIRRNLPETRRNFTLAHELGHILIPWHAGPFVCKPEPNTPNDGLSEFLHGELEKEANRFAAEFLIPTSFVQNLWDRIAAPIKMLEVTDRANVSRLAASFKFLRCLPPDLVMVEVNANGEIVRSGRTDRSLLRAPEKGSFWNPAEYAKMGAKVGSVTSSLGAIYWVDARNAFLEKPELRQDSTGREIADAIFSDLRGRYNKDDLLRSVNGMIAFANGRIKQAQSGDLYTFLCLRFKERPRSDLREFVEHPRFREFLAVRVRELAARRK